MPSPWWSILAESIPNPSFLLMLTFGRQQVGSHVGDLHYTSFSLLRASTAPAAVSLWGKNHWIGAMLFSLQNFFFFSMIPQAQRFPLHLQLPFPFLDCFPNIITIGYSFSYRQLHPIVKITFHWESNLYSGEGMHTALYIPILLC